MSWTLTDNVRNIAKWNWTTGNWESKHFPLYPVACVYTDFQVIQHACSIKYIFICPHCRDCHVFQIFFDRDTWQSFVYCWHTLRIVSDESNDVLPNGVTRNTRWMRNIIVKLKLVSYGTKGTLPIGGNIVNCIPWKCPIRFLLSSWTLNIYRCIVCVTCY